MLIIRKEQLELLSEDELVRFKERLKVHLREVFPLQTSFVNDEAVDEFIESGLEDARKLGFETEATVQSFLDHTVLLFFPEPTR